MSWWKKKKDTTDADKVSHLCDLVKLTNYVTDLEGTYTYTIKFVCTDKEFRILHSDLEKK